VNQGQQGSAQIETNGAELRTAPRIALMLRVGKLCLAQGEFLCVVRDASASGLKIKLFHDLPEHTDCLLELGTGDQYRIAHVWTADGHAGYRFTDGTIDLSALIDEATPFPRRQLRLRLDRSVSLIIDGVRHEASLRDISQHGVLIDYPERLPLGLAVQIESPGMPVLEGRIRWRLSRSHGVVLQRSFKLDELAALALVLQDRDAA
jgi:hypothetical protein